MEPTSLWQSALLKIFVEYVVPILGTGVLALATWGLSVLRKKWTADAGTSKLAQVGVEVTHFSDAIVADLEATLKPQLKAATADGVLTPAEFAQLRTAAITSLVKTLGEDGVARVKKVLGLETEELLNRYLGGMVEKAVDRLPQAVVVTTNGAARQALTTEVPAGGSPSPLAPAGTPGGLPTPPLGSSTRP